MQVWFLQLSSVYHVDVIWLKYHIYVQLAICVSCILTGLLRCCSFLVEQTLDGLLEAHSLSLVMTMTLQLMNMVGGRDSSIP